MNIIEAESTLTDRYQTTVPETVRQALRLGKRDKIHYTVRDNNEVVISKAAPQADPVIASFLNFLAEDMQRHPKRMKAMDGNLRDRLDSLVGNIEVDLDAPLNPEDD